MMRIGHGYDVHAFGEGDHVMLGGVRIVNDRGLVAHSDGDVALHALCDALLGAAGLGDIGRHFPDTDQAFSGADSRELLRAVVDCGFEHPSEVQHECIPQAILGMDVICQAKSGMGKTAVFVLSTLHQMEAK